MNEINTSNNIKTYQRNVLLYTKNGVECQIKLKTPEVYKVSHKQYQSIPENRIVGIDTESIERSNELCLKYLQVSSLEHEQVYDIEEEKKEGMILLFEYLFAHYAETYHTMSEVEQRKKLTLRKIETRANKKGRRDGRRKTIVPIILAFFNMDYDLGRLIDTIPVFRRTLMFGNDAFKFEYDKYTVEIVYSMLGVACPSFQWYVYDTGKKQVIRLVGFDATSYFRSTLKEAAASLESMGVAQKLDIDGDIFTRNWDTEEPTEDEIQAFLAYATVDARVHRDLYLAIVKLLSNIDSTIIDRIGSIPASAPAAAARIMMHMQSHDIFEPPPFFAQQQGLDAYRGAISFCSYPGYHTNIDVVDISSAYPHVMTLLPDFTSAQYIPLPAGKYRQSSFAKKDQEGNLIAKWGVVTIDGESLDSIYPPLVTYEGGRQRGIYGKFNQFTCTIPEVVIGVATGALKVTYVHGGLIMQGSNETSGLRAFIERMYAGKNGSEKNSPMYLMYKLLMNSLYGKFIEKRHNFTSLPTFSEDGYYMLVPDVRDDKVKRIASELWRQQGYDDCLDYLNEYCYEHKLVVEKVKLSDYLGNDSYESGYYFNAVIASQITGFVRAKLMSAARYLHAYLGDTDSLFFPHEHLANEQQWQDFRRHLNQIGAITPQEGLGSFECEATQCNALLVKKKMYVLRDTSGKIKKFAQHGISGIAPILEKGEIIKTKEERTATIMQELYDKTRVTFTSRPKPIRLKEGLRNNKRLGKFYQKTTTLNLQYSVYQQQDNNGWLHWTPLEEENNGETI